MIYSETEPTATLYMGVDIRSKTLTCHRWSSLHKLLAKTIGAASPGVFDNDGGRGEWTLLVDVCYQCLEDGLNNISGCDAWILAQLFGGNHVRSMAMSLAWLCINGLRLQDGLFAIYPSADRNERLSIALEDAWLDAEDLRGFFGYYEHDQKPEGYR